MKRERLQEPILLGAIWILLFGLACSASKPTPAPTPPVQRVEQTIQTSSYRIELEIGPPVSMPASAMTIAMATTDQGQPVNRHLEVHIYDKTSGARITDTIPMVSVIDNATRAARSLPNVLACMTLKHREIKPHFGDNLYLADGRFTVAVVVVVGDQTANFNVSL